MIENLLDVLSWIFICAGAFFVAVGALGLLRMPDLFTRIHAASIADTVGAGFLIFGMMLQAGFTLVSVKLFILLILFFFTTPVATHAVAQAALYDGEKPVVGDDNKDGLEVLHTLANTSGKKD